MSARVVLPQAHQPPLPRDRLIVEDSPGEEAIPLDVLFIGAGPAGLAGAIELSKLAEASGTELEIGVLEKAAAVGGHCLSGAVVNPSALRELFPDAKPSELPLRGPVDRDEVYLLTKSGKFRLPTPPTMRNHGNQVASLCEVVRWMGERAEERGIHVMPGYPAESLLVEGSRVIGARTTATGLDREGNPGAGYADPIDLSARITVLTEGTRGPLTQGWLEWKDVPSTNPQIFALGVKELWETPQPLNAVVHTLGWPLPRDAFGGTFMYPMGDGLVSLGIVVGLDYRKTTLDVHALLQKLKTHPMVAAQLEGGKLVEWGAKTIPEGGYHSLPQRLGGEGVLLAGDAAGFVDVPSLKGIHYAMYSGMFAARAIHEALQADSTDAHERYGALINDSCIRTDLHERRNMRLAFKSGFFSGGLQSALMILTRGKFPGGRIKVDEDAADRKLVGEAEPFAPDAKMTFSKVDAVFHADNATRDDVPSHLVVGEDIPREVAEMYHHMCPAGVYELDGDTLVVNAPNCVDCKATDVLGPRWSPREGGSGPNYKRM